MTQIIDTLPASSEISQSGILREYDIRGVVDKDLTTERAYAIARGWGDFLAEHFPDTPHPKIGLCYDGRHSSPDLTKAVAEGLADHGAVVNIYGMAPTPLAYFALATKGLDAICIITGSHNPPQYNGIKMALRDSPMYGDRIRDIGVRLSRGIPATTRHQDPQNIDITQDYLQFILDRSGVQEALAKMPLTVVWDAGNGVVGHILPDLTTALAGTHHLLYAEVDGDFPNHHPDPSVEKNLLPLIEAVKTHNAHLGIAFDGDGDRLGVVTATGQIIWGDQLSTFYARDVLVNCPNANIVLDIKCSSAALADIERHGGTPILGPSGHSLAKKNMKHHKAPFAGELSGHVYFGQDAGFTGHDDAPYAALRLLRIIAESANPSATLDQFLMDWPHMFASPEYRPKLGDNLDKFQIIQDVAREFDRHRDQWGITDILTIDGIRASFDDQSWILIRASNTENKLSMRIEAPTQSRLDTLTKRLSEQLLPYDIQL